MKLCVPTAIGDEAAAAYLAQQPFLASRAGLRGLLHIHLRPGARLHRVVAKD